nr:immunoglobulin light chain junction region [Macaca mulatta]
CQQHNSHPLAF